MNRRPIIGITSNFSVDHGRTPPRSRLIVNSAYADAVLAAGGMPHLLPVPSVHGPDLLDELVAGVDGLLFTGGEDLHPRHYGQRPHPQAELLAERRDAIEIELFRRADAARKPILAICLGCQVSHVARGAALLQHIDDLPLTPKIAHHHPDHSSAFHDVRIETGSRLAEIVGSTQIEVNSRHHQAVDRSKLAAGLRPVAEAPDGVLEAAEDVSNGRFLLAVQWHPEDLIDRPEHLAIFRAIVEAARQGPR